MDINSFYPKHTGLPIINMLCFSNFVFGLIAMVFVVWSINLTQLMTKIYRIYSYAYKIKSNIIFSKVWQRWTQKIYRTKVSQDTQHLALTSKLSWDAFCKYFEENMDALTELGTNTGINISVCAWWMDFLTTSVYRTNLDICNFSHDVNRPLTR